jgi:nitrogen fixation protein
MSISIKDVKKGTRVMLRNGWEAKVEDREQPDSYLHRLW